MIEGKPPTSKNITKKYLAKKQPTYDPRINQNLYSMRICCFMSMFSLTLWCDGAFYSLCLTQVTTVDFDKIAQLL